MTAAVRAATHPDQPAIGRLAEAAGLFPAAALTEMIAPALFGSVPDLWLVAERDHAALGEGLLALAADPTRLEAMGRAASRSVAEHWALEAQARNLEACYREAMALGDRIAVLVEGRVAQVGTPEEVYDAPATAAVARLFGDPPVNLVPAQAGPGGVRALGLHLPLRAPGPGAALLGPVLDRVAVVQDTLVAAVREAVPAG